jgi:hypothetical protein
MERITIPTPDEIRQRITDCERELKALRRLLRMALHALDAAEARHRRAGRGVRRE